MGHIPCNKRITFPSQEIIRIAYLLQHKLYNTWALYFFGKVYVGVIRCAKFLLEIKYTNHYTEKKIVFYCCSEILTNNYPINQLTPDCLKISLMSDIINSSF